MNIYFKKYNNAIILENEHLSHVLKKFYNKKKIYKIFYYFYVFFFH